MTTVQRRMRAVLGRSLHRRARAAVTPLCDDLAELADSLERSREAVVDAVVGTSGSALAREITTRLVDELAADAAGQVATIVLGLRTCGVALCVMAGRDLRRCRCLRSLTQTAGDDAVDETVDRVLRDGLAPFLPPTTSA